MMSYYYHHYHIYHHTPTAYNANVDSERTDFVDNSEEFHVYDHCRPIPDEIHSLSKTSSFRNRNGQGGSIF